MPTFNKIRTNNLLFYFFKGKSCMGIVTNISENDVWIKNENGVVYLIPKKQFVDKGLYFEQKSNKKTLLASKKYLLQ